MSAQAPSAWSRRREAVAAEAQTLERAKDDAVIAERHAELAEKTEEDVLAELDLPNPDEMLAGDDFSVFMKATVPNALRNRALRTLWRSNPVLANVDMLVDYGEDFTGKGDVIGAIKTAYQVGKGYLTEEKEPEEAAPVSEPEPETIEVAPEPAPEKAELPAPEVASPLAPRRRMRFEFVEADMVVTTGTENQ